ncbi:MAG: hypothetical protein WBF88_18880 [Pusillimonas sp.]
MLATIAGNLDTEAWARYHGVPTLKGSLNPANAWQRLRHVPQVHFAGSDDLIVPVELIQSYRNGYPAGQRPEVRIMQGFDHYCCWTDRWPELIGQVADQSEEP